MAVRAESSAPASRSLRSDFWNVPNQLTTLRFLLSVVLFGTLSCEWFLTSMILFMIAAGTDWIDGYWARKYGQVTMLGRILDPFVDKIIICGTFILLGSFHLIGSEVWAWMAVVIVGRELLVTALRSFLEQQGTDFSAKLSGKLKMVLQCFAAATSLFVLWYGQTRAVPDWMRYLLIGAVWAAVISTIQSGVVYILVALRMLRQE
ncbi:MAG TPA: CDP-diacylglycerol--glycerol-3-phosphate 3-phosphatidyltransferase [Pirellulales bacterium]|jgi:CDP-diacylglycerol--glycerol-3-phosphate 3-phosphatidyltransferase|nr:CDP-diacylglycerol--glycerol-3-phosphate 3-phosphatidyltransferase [Pirellulales bacterium]